MVGQSKLNLYAFSGNEQNKRAQSYSPSADVYTVAAHFLPSFPLNNDRNRDWTAEVAASLSQDQSISRLEYVAD